MESDLSHLDNLSNINFSGNFEGEKRRYQLTEGRVSQRNPLGKGLKIAILILRCILEMSFPSFINQKNGENPTSATNFTLIGYFKVRQCFLTS